MIPLGVLASGYVAPAGGGEGVEYLSLSTTSTGTTTRTVSGVGFSTAANNRSIIIAVHTRYRAPASATIGGVAATLHALFSDVYAHTAIFSAVVPSGTSGNVTVTHAGGNPEQFALAAWVAYGTLAYDSHATNGAGKEVTVTAPSDALVIAAMTTLHVLAGSEYTFETPAGDYGTGTTNMQMQSSAAHAQPDPGTYTAVITSSGNNYGNSALLAVVFTLT